MQSIGETNGCSDSKLVLTPRRAISFTSVQHRLFQFKPHLKRMKTPDNYNGCQGRANDFERMTRDATRRPVQGLSSNRSYNGINSRDHLRSILTVAIAIAQDGIEEANTASQEESKHESNQEDSNRRTDGPSEQ